MFTILGLGDLANRATLEGLPLQKCPQHPRHFFVLFHESGEEVACSRVLIFFGAVR